MTERFTIELGDATHAVDYNQLTALLHGYGHVDGLEVSVGDGMELEIDSGEAFVAGATVDVDAQTVELDIGKELPRKDVIYVDGDGVVQVAQGTENEAIGGEGRRARMPAPVALVAVPGAPIAEVWVDQYTTSLEDGDVTDRRLTSELDVHTLSVVSAAFEEASVASAPESDTDVARKAEIDALEDALGSHIETSETHGADGAIQGKNDVSQAINDHASESAAHHDEDHAERHHAGGPDTLEAVDLSASDGDDGQVLEVSGDGIGYGSPGDVTEETVEEIALSAYFIRGV
ncbi:hypothetical protein [Natrialba sp. SSL1]|uniref:hypothetical protein n=1 Tax=Natrialba sp. SSL1 TaxID=1869245 RepID=UPI0008F87149|nr:hypothetical protein [Natrialba sp. SSL1]OIB56597.1 hypothetical protein BBD46_16545 [Natrialba sp. SSL1]